MKEKIREAIHHMMSNEFKEENEEVNHPNINPTFRKGNYMTKVRKAVIPAGWLGGHASSHYQSFGKGNVANRWQTYDPLIVEEASEIWDWGNVTGKAKRSIEDHFDSNFELEYTRAKGKTDD